METVIGVALVAVVLWGYWSFYGSGQYSSKRPPPDLSGFRPLPEKRTQDSGPTESTVEASGIGDVSDPE